MYRPHEAREDTVLFPAFHQLVSQKEYESLGDVFEDREHELFGARGFDGIVDEVAQTERPAGSKKSRRNGSASSAAIQVTMRE